MIFDTDKSIINDLINYFSIHFNKDKIDETFRQMDIDIKRSHKFYGKIDSEFTVNEALYAFFYQKERRQSFMSYFVDLYFSKINIYEHLKDEIQSELFKEEFIKFYYPKKKNITNRDLYAIDNITENAKTSFGIIITHYNEMIEALIAQLDTAYTLMQTLYSENSAKIKSFKIKSDDCDAIYKITRYRITQGTPYLISFMKPFACNFIQDFGTCTCIFGLYYEETLKKEFRYMSVTHKTFTNIVSNAVTGAIIDIIEQYKEITAPDIIKIMGDVNRISQPTVYRALSLLCNEKIIDRYYKDKKMYYILNREYFIYAKIAMNRYFMNFIVAEEQPKSEENPNKEDVGNGAV